MDTISPHPRLWFSAEQKAELLRKQHLPTVRDWIQKARDLSKLTLHNNPEVDSNQADFGVGSMYPHMESHAFLYQLEGDSAQAAAAFRLVTKSFGFVPTNDLGLSEMCQWIALVYDWCWQGWDAEQREHVGSWLMNKAIQLQPKHSECKGNPDNPFNNWFGVCNSGAGIATLAVWGEQPGAKDLARLSMERVRSYTLNYSEQGISYEGIGYGCYALMNVGSLLLAARTALGIDLADEAEGLSKALRFIAVTVINRRRAIEEVGEKPDDCPFGSRITWNDDGSGVYTGRYLAILYALSDRRWAAPIASLWEDFRTPQLLSLGNDGRGLSFLALYYPERVDQVVDAYRSLPLSVIDKRLGMALFRNRYSDADDCVFGVYAKCYHPGGHEHEDAGSFRFMGLDGGWSQSGGQNKFAPVFQSALLKDGKQLSEPGNGHVRTGQLSYYTNQPDGSGAVSMRLGRLYQAKQVDRCFAVDYSGAAGVPALLGVIDHLWDHSSRLWSWTMCFESGLEYSPLPEQNGFLLKQPRNGASCAVRFVTPQNLEFELIESAPTQRTFAGGNTKHYVPSRYIKTSVEAENTWFYAAMTLQYGEPPAMSVEGSGPDAVVRIGQARMYLQRGKWFHGPVRIEKVQ